MKNKGFTLIELLAVLVILAVVALIAFPVITGIIEKTKKSAALRSIEGYVEAANNAAVIYDVDNNKGIGITDTKHIFTSSSDTSEFSKIKAKGTLPTYSYIDFNTKTKAVKEGHFCISGYSVIYENNQARISDNNYCGDEENVEVIIIPKDEDGSCVNAQAASDKPIYKYEATGDEDDYVYECKDGQWEKFVLAGRRWDGYIFNNGTYNSDYFTTNWLTKNGVNASATSAALSGDGFFLTTRHAANPASTTGVGEFVMNKAIVATRPCKIKVTYDLLDYRYVNAYYSGAASARIALKSTTSLNGSSIADAVLTSSVIGASGSYTFDLTDPSYQNRNLYLGALVNTAYQANASQDYAQLKIKKIEMLFE